MKRLSFFGLVVLFTALFSCNEKAGEEGAAVNSSQQEMLEANRQVQRAIETGDTAMLRKYIAEDAVDHGGGPNGEDVKGDDIIQMLASFHNDIDNLKFEVIEEAANDDHVFCLVHLTGTTKKAIWGMPANHNIDSRSVDVVKMKDGKVVDHWGFYDMAEMMQMMQGGKPADAGMGKDTAR